MLVVPGVVGLSSEQPEIENKASKIAEKINKYLFIFFDKIIWNIYNNNNSGISNKAFH